MVVVWLNHKAPLFDTKKMFPDAHFVHIVPSEKLGNIITGTMNFNPDKIRHYLELGYQDALKLGNELRRL